MKNRNVKVIDEHNIDRNASVMFALELDGSEYVVYWIERDQDSNNVFVSKVLKNIDGTYNMLNIDDSDKKKEVAEIVKVLVTNAVSDQNDKMTGTSITLSNGKVVKFTDVSFNKEQNINVSKTYITTVKKEVTKVAENYYDVIIEETKVADVLPSVAPVAESMVDVFPEIGVVETPVVVPTPEITVAPTPVVVAPEPVVAPVTPAVVEPITVQTVPVQPIPVVVPATPVSVAEPVAVLPQAPVTETVVATPVVNVVAPVAEPAVVVSTPTPVAPAPVVTPEVAAVSNQPLVFNAASETNLNAALGEVANSTTIPVENIQPVREFGIDAPVLQPTIEQQPAVNLNPQPSVVADNNVNTGKAGFANSKFFMVVAIAFFLASCIFLGYEVYNYFQLVK